MRYTRIALLLLFCVAPVTGRAIPIMDQHFGDPTEPRFGGVFHPNYSDVDYAQTFTVGLTGALTRIGIKVGSCCAHEDPNPLPSPLAPLQLQVVRTVSGAPSLDPADILAIQLVSQATVDSVRPPGPYFGGYSYLGWLELASQTLPRSPRASCSRS